jgi:hypothetical protein
MNKAVDGEPVRGLKQRVYYESLQECETECNLDKDCLGFVDHREARTPYCTFETSTETEEDDSTDFYSKAGAMTYVFENCQATCAGIGVKTPCMGWDGSTEWRGPQELGFEEIVGDGETAVYSGCAKPPLVNFTYYDIHKDAMSFVPAVTGNPA